MNKKTRNLFCGDLKRGLITVSTVLKEKPYHVKEKSHNVKEKSHNVRKKSPCGFELNLLEKRCLEDTSFILDNIVTYVDKLKNTVSVEHVDPVSFSLFPLIINTYNSFRKDDKSKKYCEENKIANFPIDPREGITHIKELISNYLHGKDNNRIDRIYTSMFLDKLIEEEQHVHLRHYEEAIETLVEVYSSTKK